MTKLTSVSFVFPMYNEAENIAATIRRASALAQKLSDDYEVVVVDDASTDRSGEIVDRLAREDAHVRSIRLDRNTKFGGALKTGLFAAKKDVIIYTDADFPAKDADIIKAAHALEDADIVTAYSLVIKDASLKRIIMSKTYNFLVHLFFGLRLHDINSGLKIYRKRVFDTMRLQSESPFIDVEIFAEAIRKGCQVKQYGLIFDLRTGGVSTISRPGVVAKTFIDMVSYWVRR